MTEAEDKKIVIRQYRKLMRRAKPFLKPGDSMKIGKAFCLASEAHKGMRRQSNEPYILHPLAVAQICVEEIGLGTSSIIAALLHDTVEDTDVTLDEIEKKMGKKIAFITEGLTKIKKTIGKDVSTQAENYHKITLTLTKDARIILIKLADRLHNMRTLSSLTKEKQLKIASETIYFYAPLAHRLGLNAIKSEMEDIYLRFTDIKIYQEIVSKIEKTKVQRDKFVRQFVRPIKKDINELGLTYKIKSRPKSIHSIWKKMCKQNIPFEEVYDLFAIRIIIDSPIKQEKPLCWQIYSTITNHYTPNPDRLRDWISMPKANGYESLHTTVMAKNGQWVEVQIRTKRMDEIAEKGYAAHWKYKDGPDRHTSNLEKWLIHIRESLEKKDLSALEWMDNFKESLFHEEIFVFTPMGEMKTLPQGSTALDFAFEIHSDIGKQCLGAKVNQKLEAISHVLKNGDQVNIITSKTQKPKPDWLQFVRTSKAKSKIKEALKEHKKIIIESGKETLLKKIKRLKLSINDKVTKQLIAHFKVSSIPDLYYKIGAELIVLNDLNWLKESKPPFDRQQQSKYQTREKNQKPEKKSTKKLQDNTLLIGDDMDVLDYKLAKCCNPIPGDDVFGFVTVSEGIKIHRTNCPNSPKLLANYANRIMKAKWLSDNDTTFYVHLKITGMDRKGLVKDISGIMSQDLSVTMSSVSFVSENGIFTGKIDLYVKDINHLDSLISKLQKVEGTISITRHNFYDADTHLEKHHPHE